VQRLQPVGNYTVVGAGGDMSDFQYLQTILDELVVDEYTAGDGHDLGPAEIHEYLAQLMYARRSKIDPLWNALLVGGVKHGKRFLAYVDLLGTTYSASTLATGYGNHIAIPLLRKAVEGREDTLTAADAERILEDCMRVLFYRDARSLNKVSKCTRCMADQLTAALVVPSRDDHRPGRHHLGVQGSGHPVGVRRGHSGLRRADTMMYEYACDDD
jgi:20S proteasome subunit beta 7